MSRTGPGFKFKAGRARRQPGPPRRHRDGLPWPGTPGCSPFEPLWRLRPAPHCVRRSNRRSPAAGRRSRRAGAARAGAVHLARCAAPIVMASLPPAPSGLRVEAASRLGRREQGVGPRHAAATATRGRDGQRRAAVTDGPTRRHAATTALGVRSRAGGVARACSLRPRRRIKRRRHGPAESRGAGWHACHGPPQLPCSTRSPQSPCDSRRVRPADPPFKLLLMIKTLVCSLPSSS